MQKILEVKNLKKTFYKNKIAYVAVNNISFSINQNQCVGLIGESGCGKSTTAKMITRLIEPDSGEILLNGREIQNLKGRALKSLYADVQMIFQTPQKSFDPRYKLKDSVIESMINYGMSKSDAQKRMEELFDLVELDKKLLDRYPHQVSGGQCQRASIARALAINPKLIICDEATSALDVIVQAQIAELLKKLQKKIGLSLLLICHDLALVQKICDYVFVMYQGDIIEYGTPDEIIKNPKQEYTKILIDSVF